MHKMGNLIFDGKGIIGHDLIVKMKRSIEMLLQGFPPITVNGTAKEPITALTIYGHSTQSGTPSPGNPVLIVSAGSVMTTGKNVLPPEPGAEVHMNIPAGTKWFLVTDGTPSNGGNVFLYDAEGNVYYLAIDAGATESVNPNGTTFNVDIVRIVNQIVPGVNTAMYIGEKLPYEPYTGGVPGVNPYEGEINVSVSDGGTQSQTLTLSTPGGLPGIPVTSGGNYTDADGQQWVCDEIDLERGKYVQRVKKFVVTSDTGIASMNPYATAALDVVQPFRVAEYNGQIIKSSAMMAKNFVVKSMWNIAEEAAYTVEQTIDFNILNERIGTSAESTSEEAVVAVREWLKDNPLTFLCQLITPIETDLPAEEIAAYKALRTYSPTTTVSNDAGAWMKVGVIME